MSKKECMQTSLRDFWRTPASDEIPPPPPTTPAFTRHPLPPSTTTTALVAQTEEFFENGVVVRRITTYAAPQQPVVNVVESTKKKHRAEVIVVRSLPVAQSGRKQYTYAEKWRYIKLCDGTSVSYVASSKKINPTTLYHWRAPEMRKEVERAVCTGRGNAVKLHPLLKYGELFEALYQMYLVAREMLLGVPISLARLWCCGQNESFAKLPQKAQYESLSVFKTHFGLSLRRTTGLTQLIPKDHEERVKTFYVKLRAQFCKIKPTNIVVMDETSVLWNPASDTTLATLGAKHVTIRCEDEKKASTALLCAKVSVKWTDNEFEVISATHAAPFIIFKGMPGATVYKQANEYANKVGGIKVACTESAWMDGDTMKRWVNEYAPSMKQDDKTWCILDLFRAHTDARVVQAFKKKGFKLFYIPGGCTGKIQVHDTHINRPFKAKLQELYGKYCVEKKTTHVTREKVMDWVKIAVASIPSDVITKGVAKNILHPMLVIPPPRQQPVEMPREDGDLEAALHAINLLDADDDAAEPPDAEVSSVVACVFCHGMESLRACKQVGCDRRFHHYCSIEYNGEGSDEYCDIHAE